MKYVYLTPEPGRFVVGFFDPSNEWHQDSEHADREHAAERVAVLNGAPGDAWVSPWDTFAAAALTGYIAAHAGDGVPLPGPKEAAREAALYADAVMMARRSRRLEGGAQ